jgi:hypothetical protein
MFQINDAVSIRFSTLTGVVKGASIDQTTLAVLYLVEFVDRNGVTQERYFGVDDIAAA